MRIILASSSPRRRELLGNLGIEFDVVVADADEKVLDTGSIEEFRNLAMENAMVKAQASAGIFARKYQGLDPVYISADTIVILDGLLLTKPADREEGRRMMEMLSGRTHKVITGLALYAPERGGAVMGFEETEVTFRELSGEDVENYLDTGEYADKAGAYGIQRYGAFLVERVDGDYFNVVGFPMVRLFHMFRLMGVDLLRLAVESGKSCKEGNIQGRLNQY